LGGKLNLGEFKHMVLAAALRLYEDACGARIIQEIEEIKDPS